MAQSVVVRLPSRIPDTIYGIQASSGPSPDAVSQLLKSTSATDLVVNLPAATAISHYGLLHVPQELFDQILAYVERPSQLAALCYTCKALFHASVSSLYKRVKINIEDVRLTKQLVESFDNHGLKHIESLTLKGDRKCSRGSATQTIVNNLLLRLPENKLLDFRFDGGFEDPLSTLGIMCSGTAPLLYALSGVESLKLRLLYVMSDYEESRIGGLDFAHAVNALLKSFKGLHTLVLGVGDYGWYDGDSRQHTTPLYRTPGLMAA